MTSPATNQPQPRGHDQYDQQALDFEKALEAAATAAILAWLAATIAHATSRLQIGDIRPWLAARIRDTPINAGAAVRARISEGLRLGAGQAAEDADFGRLPIMLGVDDATTQVIDGLDATIRTGLDRAARLAEHVTLASDADVTAVVAPALAATNKAAAATRWAANRTVNVGTAAVAEYLDADELWIAERDACLTCLALSGQVRGPGETFDASLTFADKPMPLFPIGNPLPLDHPPRHPGCRCRTRIWLGGSDLPQALQREAQRTVARGWSAYASEPAKLSAADRLLQHPSLLPATVRHRARRAVATGTF